MATKSTDTGDEQYLGFVGLYETINNDGYLGAILITDHRGVPCEFRCTHPVKPSSIQKPLYGETLELHIGVNLCGIPLINSSQIKPSIVIVNRDILLNIREGIDYPVIYIRRAGETIEVNDVDTVMPSEHRERLDCPTGKFKPITLITHHLFHDDLASAREILGMQFGFLDPLEPFDRMATAIRVLAEQDKRFQ